MPNSRTDMEWIDGFLQGELSESEVLTFRERLTTEPAFAVLFEEQKLLADGIRLSRLIEKMRHFQELGQEIDEGLLDEGTIGEAVRYDKSLEVLERFKEKGKELDKVATQEVTKRSLTSYLFSRYSAAAAILLLLISFWWVNGNYSSHSIIKDLNEPFLNYQQAGIPQNNNKILKEGKTTFFSGDYKTTIDKLLIIQKQDTDAFYESQGLLAYAYFSNQNYSMAVNQFDLLINDYYNRLTVDYQDKNRLRWTRLLAYLGNNQEQTPFFKQELAYFLQHDSEKYRQKAVVLRDRLNSNWRKLLLSK